MNGSYHSQIEPTRSSVPFGEEMASVHLRTAGVKDGTAGAGVSSQNMQARNENGMGWLQV